MFDGAAEAAKGQVIVALGFWPFPGFPGARALYSSPGNFRIPGRPLWIPGRPGTRPARFSGYPAGRIYGRPFCARPGEDAAGRPAVSEAASGTGPCAALERRTTRGCG
jgi:hypothetical protein